MPAGFSTFRHDFPARCRDLLQGNMSVFENAAYDDHEKVLLVNDKASGLRAIIALHSTALGPAAGGCRLWQYPGFEAGLTDALRLSRGMSYKNAMAGLPFGGGKAVILGPVAPDKRRAAFEAFGRTVESLNGSYVTAEDVGVSVADMQWVAGYTSHVTGLASKGGGAGGDPSPYTARGVLRGIEAAVEFRLGLDDLAGVRVAVQGLGGVGGNLCRQLAKAGASLVVADIDPAKVEKICDETGARPVALDEILFCDVDVVAPCALGAVFTAENVHRIQAPVIAGGANNQLATPEVGSRLREAGILYAPDYVINAGGIITVVAEYLAETDLNGTLTKIDTIRERSLEIFHRAKAVGKSTDVVADEMAQEIIGKGRAKGGVKAKTGLVGVY